MGVRGVAERGRRGRMEREGEGDGWRESERWTVRVWGEACQVETTYKTTKIGQGSIDLKKAECLGKDEINGKQTDACMGGIMKGEGRVRESASGRR